MDMEFHFRDGRIKYVAGLMEATCLDCAKKWFAFLPEGLSDDTYLECPKCHKNSGTV